MVFVSVVETCTNQPAGPDSWVPFLVTVLRVSSNWIGWPNSPGLLSDILLTIVNLPSAEVNEVLINSGTGKSAFAFDPAILIWLADKFESPAFVIA